MRISRFDRERDYPDMAKAWEGYEWTPPPPNSLPRIGFVARRNDDAQFLGYLGLYLEDSGNVAIVDWALSNPDADAPLVSIALKALFETCKRTADKKGILYLMSFTANKAWGRKMKGYGMSEGEKDVTTYVMGLDDDVSIDFMIDGGKS
jgi:hypothetical protein